MPFSNVLTQEAMAQLTAISGWLDRIFSPWSRCGSSWHRRSRRPLLPGRRRTVDSPSPAAGATALLRPDRRHCQARQRLPESFFADVACSVGRRLDDQADRGWLWKGRRVYLFDGTTVTMPDSRENQAAYPQVYNQKLGLGFPIARLGAVISLACGAVVNLGFCQYAGKGQGEVSLLRRLWDVLALGMSCWATGCWATGRHWYSSSSAATNWSVRSTRPTTGRTSVGGGGWAPTTTSSAGPSRHRPVAGPGGVPRAARVDHGSGDADPRPAAGGCGPGRSW